MLIHYKVLIFFICEIAFIKFSQFCMDRYHDQVDYNIIFKHETFTTLDTLCDNFPSKLAILTTCHVHFDYSSVTISFLSHYR